METDRLYESLPGSPEAWYRAQARTPPGTLVTKITRLPYVRHRAAWPRGLPLRVATWADGRGPASEALESPRLAEHEGRLVAHLLAGGPVPSAPFGAPPPGELWTVQGPARTPGSLLLYRGARPQRKVVRAEGLALWGVWDRGVWDRTVYLVILWRRLRRFLPLGDRGALTWEACREHFGALEAVARAEAQAEQALALALEHVRATHGDQALRVLCGVGPDAVRVVL